MLQIVKAILHRTAEIVSLYLVLTDMVVLHINYVQMFSNQRSQNIIYNILRHLPMVHARDNSFLLTVQE
jgi:hypothetical protein